MRSATRRSAHARYSANVNRWAKKRWCGVVAFLAVFGLGFLLGGFFSEPPQKSKHSIVVDTQQEANLQNFRLGAEQSGVHVAARDRTTSGSATSVSPKVRGSATTVPPKIRIVLDEDYTSPFNRLGRWSGVVPPGSARGHESLFLGVFTGCHNYFELVASCLQTGLEVHDAPLPKFSDHIYEWHGIIMAISTARSRFNMLELGGGWAKWSVDAAKVVDRLRPGLQKHMIAVEAQPAHCDMARAHIKLNKEDADVEVLCGAAAEKDGEVDFVLAGGHFGLGLQHIADHKVRPQDTTIKIPSYGLCGLVKRSEFSGEPIDFLDLDVQGFELAILKNSASCATEWVRVLHIGIHRVETNDVRVFRDLFVKQYGWVIAVYLPVYGKRVGTRFRAGTLSTSDGVLTLVNPQLAPELARSMPHLADIHDGSYTDHPKRNPSEDWAPGEIKH